MGQAEARKKQLCLYVKVVLQYSEGDFAGSVLLRNRLSKWVIFISQTIRISEFHEFGVGIVRHFIVTLDLPTLK